MSNLWLIRVIWLRAAGHFAGVDRPQERAPGAPSGWVLAFPANGICGKQQPERPFHFPQLPLTENGELRPLGAVEGRACGWSTSAGCVVARSQIVLVGRRLPTTALEVTFKETEF